jgi:FAD/FMN-containing dehydrogenase
MSKVAHYLQEHLTGEVMISPDARRYFATDSSVLALLPAMAVYPQNENDIRKTARFTWQLAERGRVIPMIARGAGTDQGGAALGAGIMMAFTAHMNRIIEFDSKSGVVVVQASNTRPSAGQLRIMPAVRNRSNTVQRSITSAVCG